MVKSFYIDYQYVPATAIASIKTSRQHTKDWVVYLTDGRTLSLGGGYWDDGDKAVREELKQYFGIE